MSEPVQVSQLDSASGPGEGVAFHLEVVPFDGQDPGADRDGLLRRHYRLTILAGVQAPGPFGEGRVSRWLAHHYTVANKRSSAGGGSVSALDIARAALQRAEQHVGVTTLAPPVAAAPPPEPGTLLSLLPDGDLPRGGATVVRGSNALLLSLLAATQGDAGWVAIVGAPDLGLLAAAQLGLALERTILVPDPGLSLTQVCAAFIDGVATLVMGPNVALTLSEQGRLGARAREQGTALVTTQAWPGALVTLTAGPRTWDGVGHGSGYLRAQHLAVTRTGRASAAGERVYNVLLSRSVALSTAQDVTAHASRGRLRLAG